MKQHRAIPFLTIIISLFPVLLYAQGDNTNKFPVYRNNDIVGYLYAETILNDEDCYSLDTLNIFGKNVLVQTAVGYRGYADSIQIFYPYFFIELETNNNKVIIKFNSTLSGDTYWLSLKKEKSGAVYVCEELLWYPNSFVHIEIAKDDFNSFNCSHICRKKVHRLVNEKIAFTDYFNFNEGKASTDCFDCPIQYSLEECVKMKKNGKVFIWKE